MTHLASSSKKPAKKAALPTIYYTGLDERATNYLKAHIYAKFPFYKNSKTLERRFIKDDFIVMQRLKKDLDKIFKSPAEVLEFIEDVDYRWRAANQKFLQTIDLQDRSYILIKFVIDWAFNDSFWAGNIRSVAKLRKQAPHLLERITSERQANPQIKII